MNKIIKNEYYIIFSFIIYFILGCFIYSDYVVTPDEPLHRINGFISLKYISDFFNLNFDLSSFVENIPDLHTDWRKTYGTAFDLPLSYIEYLFKIHDKSDVFLLRHFSNFFLFFISSIFFYRIIKKKFNNCFYGLIGFLILISTPRIFSQSFYNSKDIVFLSFFIIGLYYSIKLLNKFSYKNLLLSLFFCALATNIRILGIYLPMLVCFFYYFKEKQFKSLTNFKFIILYFFGYFLSLYVIWPYLWSEPINNFFSAFSESMNYPSWWKFKVLYFGNYINPENLPWHYFFFWFFATTPIFILFFIISGLIFFLKKFLKYFISIDLNKDIILWRNKEEMFFLFIFLIFFIPIFMVIVLNSTMYNGWRHLYFVYPSLIIFIFYLINFFQKNKKIYNLLFFTILIQVFFNFIFIYKSHPVQNIYFNFFAKKIIKNNFPIDYWGAGNGKSIMYLIDNSLYVPVISTSSYTNLNNLQYDKKILSHNSKYVFVGTSKVSKKDSNYIFTNYFYHSSPNKESKYIIPKEFTSYYKLVIDGILVNEIFIKK